MSHLFSKLRRSSTVADRYASKAASYASADSARRHARFERDSPVEATAIPPVSFENIPALPSPTKRGASSQVSLRSEYSHLDNDTNRYPKFPNSNSGTSTGPGSSRRRRSDGEVIPKTVVEPNKRMIQSQIAPLLAVGSLGIRWDVRDSPTHMRQYRHTRRTNDLSAPALSTNSRYLCIVSHEFPWTLAISTHDGRPLTILDIIEALYDSLIKEVRRSEWALATDGHRYMMLNANKSRRQSPTALSIRRVDWLGTRYMFRGLEKDEELARKRLMPGDRPEEVWAIRFGSLQ